ncbi:hypothetical protein [Streptomyces sp. AK02-01A]|uniref:hypothetical protein n=1 Tax=Streptomyces sp. AK02-01A TaxID=3028648 RepID=UPI0029B1EF4B|nr:hypothetical protein [Streptomyces sp. AK02-01A]MDX3853800.1 hypothetical protein [Streptomyces sp. AK02-01A]
MGVRHRFVVALTVALTVAVALLYPGWASAAGPGRPAGTGAVAERWWLLGGMVVALAGAGVVALAAARGRRRG